MIDGAVLEAAERMLRVVYDEGPSRQLDFLNVDQAALDKVTEHLWEVIERRYGEARSAMDPRIFAAFNTAFRHMFLVGVIAGRQTKEG